jgi:Zn-dependent M28 family amino/carboxypeptidase
VRRVLLAVGFAAAVIAPATAHAADRFNSAPYRKLITVPNMLQHSYALQDIADRSGTQNRVAGSLANKRTVNYVAEQMRDAGWTVKKQPFEFPYYEQTAQPTFERTAPDPKPFVEGTDQDFRTMDYSGTGDVTASVVPVDVTVPMPAGSPPSTSNSGCQAEDFKDFPAGSIALVQRGTCTFLIKAQNAVAAGAVGLIVFNEGPTTDTRTGVVAGSITQPTSIPAVGTTYQIGVDFVNAWRNGLQPAAHIKTQTFSEIRTTWNVIADSPFGDPNRTVVVSAHNDSVAAGPGINDDGSGTAMDIELAKNLGKKGPFPRNHMRFLWVGDEEGGLVGSQFYVDSLTDKQKLKIIAMLDFDMVASPNYARQVYDGDGSTAGNLSGPGGSGFIEGLFNDFFAAQDQATEPIPFDGRSDYVAFTNAGIPAGGVFTGAEKPKTHEEFLLFGGTEGQPLDPCYHQACDTVNNLNLKACSEMSQAAADVTLQLAMIQGPIRDGRPVKPAKKLAAVGDTLTR